jgi:hypothetical protein
MGSSNFVRNVKLFVSVALIFLGFVMFYGWGLTYGSWNIFAKEYIGVYTIVIVLVLSGILGLLLTVRESSRS